MEIEQLYKEIPERIPAEISDKIQYFLSSNADQQMRFIIYLGGKVDIGILKKAFRLTIYSEPIFSFTFKENSRDACWQKQNDPDPDLLLDLIETEADVDNEVHKFLTFQVSPFRFPIVKSRIIRNSQKDVLCINMNHTPTDGAGLKEFVKTLASNYNKLLENSDYCGSPNPDGDRSIRQVTGSFTFLQLAGFVRQGFKKPKRLPSWSFGWNKQGTETGKYFRSVRTAPETFDKIKAFGKLKNATVNDLVLAAFIRTFAVINPENMAAAKPVIIPVDLRKYIRPGHKTGICSLTSSLICNIGSDTGTSFSETLGKVCDEMNRKKRSHSEMNMLAPFLVLSKFIPYQKLKEQTMQRKMPPIPLVTNLGIINPQDIDFGRIPVEYSYVTGVISYKDYFSMAYSTFNKVISFSIGFTGGEAQEKKVDNFLSRLKAELEGIQ
jgi:NRPS condensation-like uncharacterized protein